MKVIIVALALVACAAAAAAAPADVVPIVRSNFDQDPEGNYNFGFETGDGNTRQEEGIVKDTVDEENKPVRVISVRGSYSYTDKDGKLESITYYADETGFHADGESVPKPPARR